MLYVCCVFCVLWIAADGSHEWLELGAIQDLKAPFPDLKAGHVDHLLTCVYFSTLCLLLLYCCLLFIFLPIFVFLYF